MNMNCESNAERGPGHRLMGKRPREQLVPGIKSMLKSDIVVVLMMDPTADWRYI